MAVQQSLYTVEEFDQFILKAENVDKLFEYVGGEIVEVPSNPYVSQLALMIGALILSFVRQHKLGHVTGEAGGYMVAGERYAPDVAFISRIRQPQLAKEGYNPNPPDLAVEIISSNRVDELHKLRIKISNYLSVGTVVWVVTPEDKQIEVYAPGQTVRIYREADTLLDDQVLPGFSLSVAEIFEQED